ncbi:DUF4436 family protein [Streptomyces sp. NPDC015661]|uniref:DUF4436 family protein n=1 Tax=Streptomyces sp. NPDC015661 TaxID=3364961 RepID=UPI0036FD0030
MSSLRRQKPGRGRVLPAVLACCLVVAAITLGTWLQFGERQALDRVDSAGGSDPDRVDIEASVQPVDALYSATVDASGINGAAVFDVGLARSSSVLVFAVFMMAATWALAVSVVIGAWYLVTRRKGLTWPAPGWMAATLFALAAFRNAAPGTPPIGCLLDCLAFLWAEAVIACCLLTVVVSGFKTERHPTSAAPL